MKMSFWIYLLCFAFVFKLPTFAAESPADLLQKGLFEEEANHNLESAIKVYQSVIQQTDEQRKLGATAIFRLGECYRKLGQTNDALIQYRRLLRDFPDQEKLIQVSQKLVNELQPSLDVSSPVTTVSRSQPVSSTEEAEELQRINALVKDSPDLINAPLDIGKGPGQSMQTRLHVAAMKGWRAVAEFLLANKADVNVTDRAGNTPLHYAARGGHKSLVDLLLVHGADVNAADGGLTPLHEAARQGFKNVVETLLAGKAMVSASNAAGWTPLHYAAKGGHRLVGEVLLNNKADVNARSNSGFLFENNNYPAGITPVFLAADAGQSSLVELLCESGGEVDLTESNGNTPLHYAANSRSLKTVSVLLAHRANPKLKNAQGITALHNIINSTAEQSPLQLLLDAGADPNAISEVGNYPLLLAASLNHTAQAQVLLAAKADPNATNRSGTTALFRACERAYDDMVNLLLTNQANPNIQNSTGWTPLHQIVWDLHKSPPSTSTPNKMRVLKLLLGFKANVNLRNNDGLTPLNLFGIPAKTSGSDDERVIALLKEHDATDELPQLPPNPKVIRIWRKGLPQGFPIWTKPRSGENRFTLLEAIWSYYRSSPRIEGFPAPGSVAVPTGFRPSLLDNSYDFPDLSRIIVHRLTGENHYEEIKLSLVLGDAINCKADMELVFGDVVEIPEKEHALGARPAGLDEVLRSQIKECVAQHVQLVVKGNATELALNPGSGRYLSQALKMPEALKVLVSSSDFSKVKVTRLDKKTGKTETILSDQTPFRQGAKPLSDDLLLIEGDIIEVPEK